MKRNTKRLSVCGAWLSCLSAVWLWAATANADGLLAKPQMIPTAQRTTLATRIQTARQQHPDWFRAVQSVRDRAGELDAHKRGRLAPLGPLFKSLGSDALLPMVEMTAFEAKPRGALRDSAWRALRAGLLEALGDLRDPTTRPVLIAVLDGPETDEVVVRAAAGALGKLAEDSDAQKLIALARTPGAKQQGVWQGMAECRRAAVASSLSDLVASRPQEAGALVLVRALGAVGSAWAWKTPAVAAHSNEESAVRSTAARALMDAFVAWSGQVRQAASDSLMLVDDGSTPQLIAAARQGASAELSADLDRLASRFARNPTR